MCTEIILCTSRMSAKISHTGCLYNTGAISLFYRQERGTSVIFEKVSAEAGVAGASIGLINLLSNNSLPEPQRRRTRCHHAPYYR